MFIIISDMPEFTTLQIVTPLMPDLIMEGDYVVFKCSAQALPDPEYSLYNSTTLLQKKAFGEMILAHVKNDQEGEYRCQATNAIGNGEMVARNLTVHGVYIFRDILVMLEVLFRFKVLSKRLFSCIYLN